jgi:hypothetical protein
MDANEQGELKSDPKEASRFIEVGSCAPKTPKTLPSMSKVNKMLTGKMDADGIITKPWVISDIKDLKIQFRPPFQ